MEAGLWKIVWKHALDFSVPLLFSTPISLFVFYWNGKCCYVCMKSAIWRFCGEIIWYLSFWQIWSEAARKYGDLARRGRR